MLSGEIIVGRRSWPGYDKARIKDCSGFSCELQSTPTTFQRCQDTPAGGIEHFLRFNFQTKKANTQSA